MLLLFILVMTPGMGRTQLHVRAIEKSRAQECQGMGRDGRGTVPHSEGVLVLAIRVALLHRTRYSWQ